MPNRIARISAGFALATFLVFTVSTQPACNLVKKSVEVEKLLTPLAEAEAPELIAAVNRMVGPRSIRGKVDIQFEDTSFASSGIAEKYRTADGTIIVQRPGKVYLIVQGPLAIDIAQMTSDGEHFRIAILKGDEKYRRFVRGTNAAVYAKMNGNGEPAVKGKPNTEAQTVKALSNLRPQHLTDALMVRSIDTSAPGLVYARSEFFQSEKDPASKKRVVRGYYFLDELQTGAQGSARLLRRFWFNRVNGIQLARLQTFDDAGALTTDVTYADFKPFGQENTFVLPSKIGLTRPQDHYQITITYQSPDSVTLDRDYPPEAFILENKWELKEVDLDAQKSP
ncbi:MAG TPA: hypothetical protein VJT71_10825 [Pyrinomonadaceae bacterium]|nr:hypothetical protein [Pyrinomonadaceae bacterium]